MAAIDFPNAPVLNQIFSAPNGVVYKWNGVQWIAGPTSGGVATPVFVINSLVVNDPGTFASGNTDTAMLITQGTQIFSQVFTALDPTHPIEIDCYAMLGTTNSQWEALALYIDGVAAPVRQAGGVCNTYPMPFVLKWSGVLAAGAHTFAIRFGGSGNSWINGNSAVRIGGGAQAAWLRITEVGVGPVGAQGAMGPTGAGSAWGEIAKFNIAAPQALIVSDGWQAGGWKDIHILAQLLPVTNNVNPVLQFRKGGSTLVDPNYASNSMVMGEGGAASYTSGSGAVSLMSVVLSINNVSGMALDMRIPNIASLTAMHCLFDAVYDFSGSFFNYQHRGASRYTSLGNMPIDGISFGFSAGNIAAGSRMIVMGTK